MTAGAVYVTTQDAPGGRPWSPVSGGVGFIFGSLEEVARIESYHAEEPLDSYKSPLFGKRGLFATTTV